MSTTTPSSGCAARRDDAERGSASLQVVLYTPLLFFTIVLLVFGGRVAIARQAFTQVASAAARTASLARTDGDAHQQALAGARSTLDNLGLHCDSDPQVTVTGSVTATGPGQVITATVSCQLSIHDTWVPLSAARTMTATAASPVDQWRGR